MVLSRQSGCGHREAGCHYALRTWLVRAQALGLLLALLFLAAIGAHAQAAGGSDAATVWIADGTRARKVASPTDQILITATVADSVRAIGIDPDDRTVSLLGAQHISRIDTQGLVQSRVELRDLGQDVAGGAFLLVNPYDGSRWIGTRQTVLRVDRAGQVLWRTGRINGIRSMTQGLSQDVWLISGSTVQQLTTAGQVNATLTVPGAQALAVDSMADQLWVLTGSALLRYNLARLADPASSITPPTAATDTSAVLASDQISGRVWVARGGSLLTYGRDGSLLAQAPLPAMTGIPTSMAFDTQTSSLWLATDSGVFCLSTGGAVTASLPTLAGTDSVIGVSAVGIAPALSLAAPPEGALVNTKSPLVRFALSALCNGEACAVPPLYLSRLVASATLNATNVSSSLALIGNELVFTPQAPLLEGQYILTAELVDPFGT